MIFRKPKISQDFTASSIVILQDALSQYDVSISLEEGLRELRHLKMDDIDFIEAVQMIESFIGAKIDRSALSPSITINRVAILIDQARNKKTRK